MRKLLFLFFIISFLLFSCHRQENTSKIIPPTTTIKKDTIHEVEEFEGLYFPSKPGSSGLLKVCFTESHSLSYPVVDETNSLDTLYKKTLPNAYPFQTIYIKAKGELIASGSQADPYTLQIKSVLKTEFKNYQNDCIPYEYWCMGNEPFWQLQISEKENLIDFYDPMEQKTVHFNYSKSQIKNGNVIYSAKNGIDTIEIKIKKEKCSDGMSEKKYNNSVTVQLNNKIYKGCAVAFGEVIQ